MARTQLYGITLVTLWVYDYFLTVDDEVAGFINETTQREPDRPI